MAIVGVERDVAGRYRGVVVYTEPELDAPQMEAEHFKGGVSFVEDLAAARAYVEEIGEDFVPEASLLGALAGAAPQRPLEMRKLPVSVSFGGYGPCEVYERRYPARAGGGRALVLMQRGEEIAVATVNVEGVSERLADGCVVIKDYSENEGMLAALVEAGAVEDTGMRTRFGYVEEAPIARILY